jgi:hypothetical protein
MAVLHIGAKLGKTLGRFQTLVPAWTHANVGGDFSESKTGASRDRTGSVFEPLDAVDCDCGCCLMEMEAGDVQVDAIFNRPRVSDTYLRVAFSAHWFR